MTCFLLLFSQISYAYDSSGASESDLASIEKLLDDYYQASVDKNGEKYKNLFYNSDPEMVEMRKQHAEDAWKHFTITAYEIKIYEIAISNGIGTVRYAVGTVVHDNNENEKMVGNDYVAILYKTSKGWKIADVDFFSNYNERMNYIYSFENELILETVQENAGLIQENNERTISNIRMIYNSMSEEKQAENKVIRELFEDNNLSLDDDSMDSDYLGATNNPDSNDKSGKEDKGLLGSIFGFAMKMLKSALGFSDNGNDDSDRNSDDKYNSGTNGNSGSSTDDGEHDKTSVSGSKDSTAKSSGSTAKDCTKLKEDYAKLIRASHSGSKISDSALRAAKARYEQCTGNNLEQGKAKDTSVNFGLTLLPDDIDTSLATNPELYNKCTDDCINYVMDFTKTPQRQGSMTDQEFKDFNQKLCDNQCFNQKRDGVQPIIYNRYNFVYTCLQETFEECKPDCYNQCETSGKFKREYQKGDAFCNAENAKDVCPGYCLDKCERMYLKWRDGDKIDTES